MDDPQSDPNYHPSFKPPAKQNATIWRYMDFPKFTWMILEHRLFMPRSAVLAKSDPFEASTPVARYNSMRKAAEDASTPSHRQTILDNIAKLSAFADHFKNGFFVSCWYLSEYESDAMWKLYGGTNNCVAVRSTFARLKACLPKHAWVGLVSYIDYNTQDFPMNMLENVMHKRRAFEHEREVRAVAMSLPNNEHPHVLSNSDKFGYFPVIEIEKLITCVYVHPLADDWFLEAVRKTIRAAGHNLHVERSEIAAVPVF